MHYTPNRVVSLQPSATVTLRDLGLLGRLVACTKYCADACPEISEGSRIIVSDSWSAQAEQIVAAKPDLVLASVPYQLEAVAEILKAGVRFLGLAPRTLSDIYADIMAIAGVMGAGSAGENVIARMEKRIAEVRQVDCRTCRVRQCSAKNGGSRSSLRSRGLRSWLTPQEATSSARPEKQRQRKRSRQRIRT